MKEIIAKHPNKKGIHNKLKAAHKGP